MINVITSRFVLHRLFMLFSTLTVIFRIVRTLTTHADQPLRYRVRQGTLDDVSAIQQCNIANLPENYDYHYLQRYITLYPDLVYVAEKIDDTNSHSEANQETRKNEEYDSNPFVQLKSTNDKPLMGYVFGKLECSYENQSNLNRPSRKLKENVEGHVTSLAVYKEYRGHGVAKKLLNALHLKFADVHEVDKVSLMCRPSNTVAIKLYTEYYNYHCSVLIPSYYHDPVEDAWKLELQGLQYLSKKGFFNDQRIDSSKQLPSKPVTVNSLIDKLL